MQGRHHRLRTWSVKEVTRVDVGLTICEGNIGDSDMHDMVLAVSASGASPVVRIRGISAPLIKRALDTGAQ
jgi:hypothetical protein